MSCCIYHTATHLILQSLILHTCSIQRTRTAGMSQKLQHNLIIAVCFSIYNIVGGAFIGNYIQLNGLDHNTPMTFLECLNRLIQNLLSHQILSIKLEMNGNLRLSLSCYRLFSCCLGSLLLRGSFLLSCPFVRRSCRLLCRNCLCILCNRSCCPSFCLCLCVIKK